MEVDFSEVRRPIGNELGSSKGLLYPRHFFALESFPRHDALVGFNGVLADEPEPVGAYSRVKGDDILVFDVELPVVLAGGVYLSVHERDDELEVPRLLSRSWKSALEAQVGSVVLLHFETNILICLNRSDESLPLTVTCCPIVGQSQVPMGNFRLCSRVFWLKLKCCSVHCSRAIWETLVEAKPMV